MEKYCSCNSKMREIREHVTHFIFGIKVEVRNTPLYICLNCHKKEYVFEEKVERKVIQAFDMKLDSIDYDS